MTLRKTYTAGASGPEGQRGVLKVPFDDIVCKFCGSRRVIRYGTYGGVQRFWCHECRRKFADNDALPNMQTPVDQVGAAVGMFYEGQSLNSIRRLLAQIYNSYPSDSTIYRWVVRFTKQGLGVAEYHSPTVGDTWVADETVLKIDGGNVWFWDIIDADTRFLLASRITRTRSSNDARLLMGQAAKRAGKTPKIVITDRLASYIDGIERAFGRDSKHIQSKPFTHIDSTNVIERFHGTLKARTKVMRGLKDIPSAQLITKGWLLHYNYLRGHESLGDRTPAQAAGVAFPYRNWQDIVASQKIVTPRQTSTTSAMRVPVSTDAPKHALGGHKIAPKKRRGVRGRTSQPTVGLSRIR